MPSAKERRRACALSWTNPYEVWRHASLASAAVTRSKQPSTTAATGSLRHHPESQGRRPRCWGQFRTPGRRAAAKDIRAPLEDQSLVNSVSLERRTASRNDADTSSANRCAAPMAFPLNASTSGE